MNYIKSIHYYGRDPRNRLDAFIRGQLTSHFQARRVAYRVFYCRYHILGVENSRYHTEVSIRVESVINGKTLLKTFTTRRVKPGAGRGITGAVVRGIIASARGGAKAEAQEMLFACLQECVADIQLAFDRKAGVAVSNAEFGWQTVKTARLATAAIGLLIFYLFIFRLFSESKDQPVIPLMIFALPVGALFAGMLFFLVHTVGILLMPARFFRDTPTGRRTLLRVGVKSVIAAKLVALVIAVSLSAVLSGLIYISSLPKHDDADAEARLGESRTVSRLLEEVL